MIRFNNTLILLMIYSILAPSTSVLAQDNKEDGYWKGNKRLVSPANTTKDTSPEKKKEVAVNGIIMDEGGNPMEGCKVCFFDLSLGPTPKPESNWWRIPDHEYPGLIDSAGNFNTNVPEAEYVIASVERLDANEDFGPPKKGERVYLSEPIDLKGKKTVNIKKGTSRIHRNQKNPTDTAQKTSRIEGKLLKEDGSPFEGGFVIAYPYGFLSKRTKADGSFTLNLPQGGKYRLIARNVYGFT